MHIRRIVTFSLLAYLRCDKRRSCFQIFFQGQTTHHHLPSLQILSLIPVLQKGITEILVSKPQARVKIRIIDEMFPAFRIIPSSVSLYWLIWSCLWRIRLQESCMKMTASYIMWLSWTLPRRLNLNWSQMQVLSNSLWQNNVFSRWKTNQLNRLVHLTMMGKKYKVF